MMKNEVLALSAAVMSIAGGQLIDSSSNYNRSGRDGTKVAISAKPNYQTIDLSRLPPKLPSIIRNLLSTVVSTEVSPDNAAGNLPNGIPEKLDAAGMILGTAVRVAKDTYLSAGHLMKNGNDTYTKSARVCGDDVVTGASIKPTEHISYNGHSLPRYGSDLEVEKLEASFIEGDRSNTPDVALLFAPDSKHTLPTERSASVALAGPQIGESVFFVNFQPTPQGLFRSASQFAETALNYYVGDFNNPVLTNPAVVGGIIIAKDTNGDLEVADGFKGYDAAGDKTLIPGASGGAAFNSLGQLVGISIEATPANKPLTAAQMAGKYAVHLTGTPRDSSVFDITVQTITNNELNNLETSLPETDNCAVS